MHLQFCGAAREVTGSSHLLTLDSGYRILLDCGLYQGYAKEMQHFNNQWLFEPSEIDTLILSHAHIDHAGRIPKLVADGFRGAIHSTHATRSLCSIMLLDSAKIQENDAEYFNKRRARAIENDEIEAQEPLYTIENAGAAMELFVGYGYNLWFKIHEQVEIYFSDMGHILGSAGVTLKITENGKTTFFGFTGDIGRPNRPILRDPQPMPPCDYLICESTYGDRDHERKPAETERFLEIIKHTCIEKKGKILVPAFSVGRTQELVYLLDQLITGGQLPPVKVYVDSPLAVNATTVYGAHPECFDTEITEYMLTDPNPFGFNSLTYIQKVEDSKALNLSDEPCIIISSAGMANAGRIKHHIANNIEDPRDTVLIVGYASPDTPAGKLRDGATEIKLFGEMRQVRAEVQVMDSFSAHAGQSELVAFLENQRASVQQLFLVHGEFGVQEQFRTMLLEKGFQNVAIPRLGEQVELF
jgi:metallo-beta-lactamase family protein